MLGPNGGGKTTLFRALIGELEPLAGLAAGERRRGRYVAQTERTRLDFPVSALDVALMGALAHGRWWLPPAAPSARPRAAALERVGLADEAPATRSASSRAASASASLLARALVQDAPRAAARRAARGRRPGERRS